jgi:DNA-binding NarL/FixJ family response regulator
MGATLVIRAETTMEALAVIEDDPDVQFLIETSFSMGSRFTLANSADTAEEAPESARTAPGIIVLDHGLAGPLTGLEAAPRLKDLAPHVKIILFAAHAELQARAAIEPAVDGFVLKTESTRLLPLAQRLAGMDVQFT